MSSSYFRYVTRIKPFHFLLFWLVLNTVQAAFTELTSDEGYYWFYSTRLQWGYYDHPPFLACIIHPGYQILRNELGVRLINVIMNSAALFLFFKLVSPYVKNWLIIFLLIVSMPLFNYLSFIVFPDGPLLFFTIIFLLAYRRYLEREDLVSSIIMGVAMAFMFYSKYHGLLVLIFTILSNVKLLRSKFFYLSITIALMLFLPHIIWQYANGFPSLKYHLVGRMSPVSLKHLFEYVSQQIPVFGPAIMFVPFFYQPGNQFEKTLKFIVFGCLSFFLLTSLKTFIHFHWTSIIIFPLLYMSAQFYSDGRRRKLMLWLTLPVVLLIFSARLQLMIPIIPFNHANVDYYNGRRMWARDISTLTECDTVLFQDNFREASLFSFYSTKKGVTIFSQLNRKSQYDLWHYEDSLQHKRLLYIRYEPFLGGQPTTTRIGKTMYCAHLRDFSSYFNIEMNASCIRAENDSDSLAFVIDIKNPRQQRLSFTRDSEGNMPSLYYKIMSDNLIIQTETIKDFSGRDDLPPNRSMRIIKRIPVMRLNRGRYRTIFGFQFGKLKDSENGQLVITI